MTFISWIKLNWDRAAALALVLVGLVLIFVGWNGVADAVVPAGQLPYVISGGVGGLFCLGVAATLWLAAELRDQWHKLDRIERQLDALESRSHDDAATGSNRNGRVRRVLHAREPESEPVGTL